MTIVVGAGVSLCVVSDTWVVVILAEEELSSIALDVEALSVTSSGVVEVVGATSFSVVVAGASVVSLPGKVVISNSSPDPTSRFRSPKTTGSSGCLVSGSAVVPSAAGRVPRVDTVTSEAHMLC